MSRTDFFDEDLVKQREAAKRIKMGPGDKPAAASDSSLASSDLPNRPVSDLNLTRMAKHKDEINAQVAQAMEELELLRTRQEDLEREKQSLEELRRKQHEYESGRREMLGHLNQSLVRLEKDELKAEQLSELISTTRQRFNVLLAEIQDLNEEAWPEESVREELNKALARIDQVRVEYNKALARIEGAMSDQAPTVISSQPVIFEEHGGVHHDDHLGFGHWFKVGLAASLPIILTLVLILLFFYLTQVGLI